MRLVQINICDNGSTGKIMLDIFDALDDSVEKRHMSAESILTENM